MPPDDHQPTGLFKTSGVAGLIVQGGSQMASLLILIWLVVYGQPNMLRDFRDETRIEREHHERVIDRMTSAIHANQQAIQQNQSTIREGQTEVKKVASEVKKVVAEAARDKSAPAKRQPD